MFNTIWAKTECMKTKWILQKKTRWWIHLPTTFTNQESVSLNHLPHNLKTLPWTLIKGSKTEPSCNSKQLNWLRNHKRREMSLLHRMACTRPVTSWLNHQTKWTQTLIEKDINNSKVSILNRELVQFHHVKTVTRAITQGSWKVNLKTQLPPKTFTILLNHRKSPDLDSSKASRLCIIKTSRLKLLPLNRISPLWS